MTENQQRIIDSLISEFNNVNQKKENSKFNLINLVEFDEIFKLHEELETNSRLNYEAWNKQRFLYIDELITKLRDDLGDVLVVNRGDVASGGNKNLETYIYIYKKNAPDYILWEHAFRFEVCLRYNEEYNSITKEHYKKDFRIELTRYVSGDCNKAYKDEVELFNCPYSKDKIKDLLESKW